MNNFFRIIQGLISGDYLARFVNTHKTIIVILIVFVVFYIGNTIRVQKTKRDLSQLNIQLQHTRSQYIQELSKIMQLKTPSYVKDFVQQKEIGLEEAIEPLFIIEE